VCTQLPKLSHISLCFFSGTAAIMPRLYIQQSSVRLFLVYFSCEVCFTSEMSQLLLSTVTLSINTCDPVPLEATHAHVVLMTVFALDHSLLQTKLIWFQAVPEFFGMFLMATSIFAFLFLSLMNGFHFVVNFLYLLPEVFSLWLTWMMVCLPLGERSFPGLYL